VPVIVADHLSESEKLAFAIADNQIDFGILNWPSSAV
jgi:hypothetical protein